MTPPPSSAGTRAPAREPREAVDLEMSRPAAGTGTYPLSKTRGEIAGERGAHVPEHVGRAGGPAGDLERETREAGAKRGLRG